MNMYDSESNDIKFVNPWSSTVKLTDEEKDFLKYALIKINCTRRNYNINDFIKDPDLMGKYIEDDDSLLLVPLTRGDFSSEIAVRNNIGKYINEKFKYIKAIWNPVIRKELNDRVKEKITNFIGNDRDIRDKIGRGDQWVAINSMDRLDNPDNIEDRRKKI